MEKFRFYIDELDHDIDIYVLTPEECHKLMYRFSRLAGTEPETAFQTFLLGELIGHYEKVVGPLLDALGDEQVAEQVQESLFSMCLTTNPLLSVLAYALGAQEDGAEGALRLDEDSAKFFGSRARLVEDEEEGEEYDEYEEEAGVSGEAQGGRAAYRAPTPELVRGLSLRLERAVVGQGEPIGEIVRSLRRAAAGLADPERPICAFILAGCSGVGKTLLVKELNRCLYRNQPLVRIDCSEFQQEHEYAKLIGCFPPGTQVSVAGGEQRNIEDVRARDEVISERGLPCRVLDSYSYPFTGNLAAFCTRMDARTSMCTPNHNICVWDGDSLGGLEWREAGELRSGDWVFFPHSPAGEGLEPPQGIEDSPELWQFFGWYLSRGKILGSELLFSFYEHEFPAQGHLLQLASHCFGVEDASLSLNGENTLRLHLSSEGAQKFIAAATLANPRRIRPEWVEALSREQIINILLGFFGLCGKTIGENKSAVAGVYSSTQLSQLRLLAARAGYLPQCSYLSTREGNTAFQLSLLWPDLWDLVREMRGERRVKNENPYYRCLKEGVVACVSRVSNFYYSGPVYDLAVEEGVSYLVNQLLVHNSPPGYKDSDEDGYLTGRLKERPGSIVLVDEIDKASPRLFDLFLQILGEGRITDNHGTLVDCTKAAFFFTTNLGNEYAVKGSLGFSGGGALSSTHKAYVEYVTGKLQRNFRLELLGRMDDVLVFSRLSHDDYLKIVDLELAKLRKRLKGSGDLDVKLSKQAREAIAQKGASDRFGARGIGGVLREEIEDKLADYIIEHSPSGVVFFFGWDPESGFELELRDKRRRRK